MTPREGSERGKSGRYAIWAIIAGSLVLNAILLGNILSRTGREAPPSGAAGSAAGRNSTSGSPGSRGGAAQGLDGPRGGQYGSAADSGAVGERGKVDVESAAGTAGTGWGSRGSEQSDNAGRGSAAGSGPWGGSSSRSGHGNSPGDRAGAASLTAGSEGAALQGGRLGSAAGGPVSAERSPDGTRAGTAGSPYSVQQIPPTGYRDTGTAASTTPPVTTPAVTTPPVPVDDPSSDRRAPVVLSLSFDPPAIPDGSASTLLLRVTDDLSGVKTVSGSVASPSGAAVLQFVAQGEAGGGEFAARIAIPARAETGSWNVASLYIVDRADNAFVAAFNAATVPAGGSLLVSSSESDAQPPEVRSIWVEKGTIGGGEQNPIRVQVEDDRSGVANMSGTFQSRSTSALVPFMCRASSEPGIWEGQVAMPQNAECGEWTLHYIRVADNAGNIALLTDSSPQLPRVAFQLVSDSCDSTAPTLESIEMSPAIVSNEAATEVQVSASVRDEGSGAVSMSGWVLGPVATNGQFPRIFFSCTKPASDPEAPWTGRIAVPQFAAKGIWKVGFLRLQDKALNFRDYRPPDPALAQAVFEVQ